MSDLAAASAFMDTPGAPARQELAPYRNTDPGFGRALEPDLPLLYLDLILALIRAGHDVIVPSLPGFAWSDDPGRPLNAA